MSDASHQFYRREIDGLRAIAVIPVLFFHAGFDWAGGGFIGVDVFFVISGYLITGILLRDLEKDRFSLSHFYVRRIRRILPALVLVIATCIPLAFLTMSPGELEEFAQSVIATSVFGSNFYFHFQTDYFSPLSDDAPLLHTWSLAVEEQFYIAYPILLFLAYKFLRLKAFWVIAGVAILSFLLAQVGGNVNFSRPFLDPELRLFNQSGLAAFYLPFGRAWELMLGALLAISMFDRNHHRPVIANSLSTTGLALIILSVFLLDRTTPTPSAYTLVPVVGTVLVIAFATERTLVARLLQHRFIVGIGLISYSLYLWHQPLLAFARLHQVEPLNVFQSTAILIVSVPAAWLSWRFVETPVRRHSSWPNRSYFAAAMLSSLALIVASGIILSKKGFPGRYADEYHALTERATRSQLRFGCQTFPEGVQDYVSGRERFCTLNNDSPRIAVLGDSHMSEFADALAQHLSPSGEGVMWLGYNNCPPALDYSPERDGCREWTEAAVAEVTREDSSVESVVLIYRHSYYLYGEIYPGYPELPDRTPPFLGSRSADQKREDYWRSFLAVVERLNGSGRDVVVVLPIPELPAPIQKLAKHAASHDEIRGISRSFYEARHAHALKVLEELEGQVTFIDLAQHICDADDCYAVRDSVPLYFDDDHLSLEGAKLLVPKTGLVE